MLLIDGMNHNAVLNNSIFARISQMHDQFHQ